MAEQKTNYKRPPTSGSPKKEAAGTLALARNRVTLRTIGSPDPNLIVNFLAPLMLAEAGKR